MKTVYVIGAGCTRNYIPPNTFGLESPLDRDFFGICNKILLVKERLLNQPMQKKLIGFIKSLFGIELGSGKAIPEISLEKVTTILDLESKITGREYIDSLIDMIQIVFDLVLGNPRSEIHDELATLVKPNDAIISYNYDTVVDNSLMEVKKTDERIYGLHFDQKHDGDWRQCQQGSTDLSFLKLHGSLNWVRCLRCRALLFYRSRTVASEIPYVRMGLSQPSIDISCPFCEEPELATVIIPPLLQKDTQGEEFRYSWYLAEQQLIRAEKIVVIGYSLPSTDFRSELLFRKAACSRMRGKPSLHVVDMNPMVRGRFKEIFTPNKFKEYGNLREYLDGQED